MICERIKNPGSAEFAQICMKWLKSNDPTLTVKNRDGDGTNVTYFRIPLNNLDYIYVAHEYLMHRNPAFVAKYENKVTGNEDLDYPWKVATNYLQKGKEGSFHELFYELIKETKLDNWIYENLHTTNPTEADQILINFVAKGQTEEAVKQFIEKALTACEEKTPHVFTGKYEKFMYFLKEAKGIYKAVKAYCPTEEEKLTRSMCEAYNTFFKDEVPPRKIKITVRGSNEKRTFRYEKAGIDVEGKIMTMKIDPDQLTYPFRAFVLNSLSHISDFTSKDVPVMKNYKGRIELPFIPI